MERRQVYMKPRERVLRGIDHQETDRIPVGFNWATGDLITELKTHYKVSDNEGLLRAMDVDIRRLSPLVYTGEQRYHMGEKADYWGMTEKALIKVNNDTCVGTILFANGSDFTGRSIRNTTIKIDDQKVKMRLWGHTMVGKAKISLYEPTSLAGKKYLYNQFANNDEVIFDYIHMNYGTPENVVISTKNFPKAFNYFVDKCKDDGTAL